MLSQDVLFLLPVAVEYASALTAVARAVFRATEQDSGVHHLLLDVLAALRELERTV